MSNRVTSARLGADQRQACSNPIPSAPRYLWAQQPDGSLVGHREGHPPIIIGTRKPAPLHRIKHDPGTVTRTLADGLGVVILSAEQARKEAKRLTWAQRQREALQASYRRAVAEGFKVPRAPTWQQEIAGWSREHMREFGDRCLFDHCRVPPPRKRGTVSTWLPHEGRRGSHKRPSSDSSSLLRVYPDSW